ncbi:MAG TPA: hypothetical protein VFE67_06865, partial [Rudaea sp.]|nr:hypothetical protein [Rudaea sp.]
LAFALCAVVLPAAWNVRNASVPPTANTSRDRALQNLVEGSWPGYHAAWRESVGYEPHLPEDLPLADREIRKAAGREKLEPIKQEERVMMHSPAEGVSMLAARFSSAPMRYAFWYLIQKPVLLWGWNVQIGQEFYINPTKNSPLQDVPILRAMVSLCHALNPLVGIGALLVGAVAMFRRRSATRTPDNARTVSNALNAVAWLLASVTVLHVLLQAEPRYSIPYRPFEIVLAATACAWLVNFILDRRRTAALIGAR